MATLQDFWTKTSDTASSAYGTVKSAFTKPSFSTMDNGGSTDPYINNRKYAVVITQQQDLNCCKPPIVVVGAVPESLQIDQQVNWRAPWASGLTGSVGDLAAVAAGNRLVAQALTMQVWQGSGNDFEFTLTFDLRAYSSVELDVMQPLRNLLKMSVPGMDSVGFLVSPGPVLDKAAMKKLGEQIGTLGASVASTLVSGAADVIKATGKTTDGKSKLAAAGSASSDTVSRVVDQVSASGLVRKEAIESQLKNVISLSIGDWFYMNNVVVLSVNHTMKPQQPGVKGGIMAAGVSVTFKPMFSITVDDIDTILKKVPA